MQDLAYFSSNRAGKAQGEGAMAQRNKIARQNGLQPSRPPLNCGQSIYPPHVLSAITAELSEQGIPASTALAGTGLSAKQLDSHVTKISYRQIDIVIGNALRVSKDPAIALLAGQRMHITAYGMYGYAMLSSATQAEARDLSTRYHRVTGPLCDLSISENGQNIIVTIEPILPPSTSDRNRFAIEFALAANLRVIKDRAGEAFGFSRVVLDYPAPPHTAAYSDLFNCPVLFEQPYCGYQHGRDNSALALADSRTCAMARAMCEQMLNEINSSGGVAADIKRLLIERPGNFSRIDAVAGKLGMHPRALRRKLEAEGTSYRGLLADVRMRLAIEYLRKTDLINEEIAGLLGYSDASNFRHAFMRWTGKSPSKFRALLRR
jgi:AraC-like DNA-binding protein